MHQDRLGPTGWKVALQKRGLRVLTDKLNTGQQCSLAAKEANSIPGCLRKSTVSRSRELIPSLLLSTGETHVDHPVLGSPE